MPVLIVPPKSALLYPSSFQKGRGLLRPANGIHFQRDPLAGITQALIPTDISASHEYRPIVTLFMGRRGDGKSLSMTTLAEIMRRRYQDRKTPFEIASNFWMSFARYTGQSIVFEIQTFPEWARNLFLCIDEATAYFPSGRAMSRVNLDFATFLKQIRKRNIEVAFTTQFPQELTRDILRQVDLFIRCEKSWIGRPYAQGSSLSVTWYIYDFWGQWTGRDHAKTFPPSKEEYDWEKTIRNTHTMFGKYRTGEVVAPAWIDDDSRIEMIEREVGDLMPQQEEAPAALAVAVAEPPPPDGLTGLLSRQTGAFNVRVFLDDAKRMEPSIRSANDFMIWLKRHGYEIERRGAAATAWKEATQ